MDGDFACGIAGPQRARQLRGIAAEPQVGVVIGGAGLARIGLFDTQGTVDARSAALHNAGQDIGHRRGLARREHLLGVVGVLVEYRAGARIDLGNGDRLTIVTAVGKRAVGRGHFERRNRTGAERHDGDVLDISVGGVDAELFDEREDLVVTDGVCHLDIRGVGRYGRCLLERDVAIARVGVVLNLGCGALYRKRRVAVEGDVGVHAILNGSGQRKGLKRGAHGTLGRGVVDVALVGVVVVAAHHALDIAGLGVDNDHAHVQAVERKRIELGADGVLSYLLHGRVDGSLDGQAALKEHVGGELLLQKLLNVGHKVGLRVDVDTAARNLGHVERDGLGLGGIVLLLGDMAQAQHVVEDLVAAGER